MIMIILDNPSSQLLPLSVSPLAVSFLYRHFKKGLDVHLILIPAYVSSRLLRFLSVTKTVTSGPICNSELPVLPISDLRQLLSLCISQGVIAPTFCYLGFTGPFCRPDNYQVLIHK